MRTLRQFPRYLVLTLTLLCSACGGGGDDDGPNPLPNATPTPRQGPVANFNSTLLAQVDLSSLAPGSSPALTAAGIWGYTAPDGSRLALVGTSAGLSIVDVTSPQRPRVIALIPGTYSTWREVRTYRNYAYVTTEAQTGIDIIDLRDPRRPRKVKSWTETVTSAHTLWIDEARGLLFANGTHTRLEDTGIRVLDIQSNPEDPREVGSFLNYYVHDSYSRGNFLYVAAIFSGWAGILDVQNPADIREVNRFQTGGHFTHNCWLSQDGRYLFTTDERPNMPVEGWDLSDPMQPRKVSQYIGQSGTIPHNVMIDGNRMVIAHYSEGVHVLDVRNPEQPQLAGAYDTFAPPQCPDPSFPYCGTWGAYIFPGSDLIVASDMQGGLFVIRYTGPS